MQRMWINQPSKHQPLHHLHGVTVIAEPIVAGQSCRVYFTSGDVSSMQIPSLVLSHGAAPSQPKKNHQTQVKEALADFYLEWRNNWLTHEAYADFYDMDLATCTKMINQGRKWQDERAERLRCESEK